MWEARSEIITNDTYKFNIFENKNQLSYINVIRYWQEKLDFREFYFSILRESPFDAFFWENPPITKSNIDKNYEFVLVNSPQLSRVNSDLKPFEEKFNLLKNNQKVIGFENLGKDAELIVPCPISSNNFYTHLALFIRNAPENQKHEMFIKMSKALENKIGINPIWLSTSGLGVYWLHIRLDIRPKYYTYQPYRQYLEK